MSNEVEKLIKKGEGQNTEFRSLAVKWSYRYTFMNGIAVGVESTGMLAKLKSIQGDITALKRKK